MLAWAQNTNKQSWLLLLCDIHRSTVMLVFKTGWLIYGAILLDLRLGTFLKEEEKDFHFSKQSASM